MSRKVRLMNIVYCLIIVPISSFIVTIIIHLYLLSADNCNCPTSRTEYIIQNKLISPTKKSIHMQESSINHRLAVLVPFRERLSELLIFAPYLTKFLHEQSIDHDIFAINQVDGYRFNRASLINIGFLYTKSDYDYVAMHDVDLLPLNANLSYAYPANNPFHIAAPHLHPRYHYANFVGGILLVNREHFQLVNGMSNNYWGWGLEDDEFYVRLKDARLNVTRPMNITTGQNNTFKHIHPSHRRRDTTKCYNQREVTRKRDRVTGLDNVQYHITSVNSLMIDDAQVTMINVELHCDRVRTPWCDCSSNDGKRRVKKT